MLCSSKLALHYVASMAPANVRLNPVGIIIVVALGLCIFFYIFGLPQLSSDERVSMRELLSVSVDLAQRGGERVRQIAKEHNLQAKEKGKTKEGASEMLTEGDLESHRAIVYGFSKTFPGIRVRLYLSLYLDCTCFSAKTDLS